MQITKNLYNLPKQNVINVHIQEFRWNVQDSKLIVKDSLAQFWCSFSQLIPFV